MKSPYTDSLVHTTWECNTKKLIYQCLFSVKQAKICNFIVFCGIIINEVLFKGGILMNTLDNRRVVYQAIFINPEDVAKLIERQGEKLPKEVKDMHCTFKFQPSEAEIKKFSELLGKELTLKVVGYCSDGKNSGYEIELSPEQDEAYTNVHSVNNGKPVPTVEKTTPHITVSMEDGAKAVDTGMLPFSKEGFEPFVIHGKAGFFTSRMKDKERISEVIYEPVLRASKDTDKIQNHTK